MVSLISITLIGIGLRKFYRIINPSEPNMIQRIINHPDMEAVALHIFQRVFMDMVERRSELTNIWLTTFSQKFQIPKN
jgi:hypothetical protein